MYNFKYIADNGIESECVVHILHVGDTKYIGFEDINIGSSVTNSAEILATSTIRAYSWDPENCLFFEWYRDSYTGDTVDEIIYVWDDQIATNPSWKEFCSMKDNPFI
jgi:hypothetical protein